MGKKSTKTLRCKIGKVVLKNPVIAASGTFGYAKEMSKFFDVNLLGGIVTKTITLNPRTGNKPPRIYDLGFGVLNSIGLENPGLEYFINKHMGFLNSLSVCIFVSIYGESLREWEKLITVLDKEGVCAFELNFSCPNIKGETPSSDIRKMLRIIKKVRPLTNKTLAAKLSFSPKIKQVAFSLEKAGVDALTLINTIPAMVLDRNTKKPVLGNVYGGLSGPCIKPIAIRVVHETAKEVSVPVIGCGGIMDHQDVLDFLSAGAAAVEIGTATLIDPLATVKIVKGLTTRHIITNTRG